MPAFAISFENGLHIHFCVCDAQCERALRWTSTSMLANGYHTHFQHQGQHFIQGFMMPTLMLMLTVNEILAEYQH